MGLLPLEFSDCLLDSPFFRENLKAHEKQLDQTSGSIKAFISGIQEVLDAAKLLLKAKKSLADMLVNCQFECVGTSLTDDEILIASSLKQFAFFLSSMEDQLNGILDQAEKKFINPLLNFRKEHIGSVKQTKKAFEKATAKLCAAQERYIGMSGKKEESLAETAEVVRHEVKHLNGCSLEYVYLMHVVEERKKFEFVSTILDFTNSWVEYYKHGNSVACKQSDYMVDLNSRVQKTKDNFDATIGQFKHLKNKMVSSTYDPGLFNKMYTRQGYLFVQTKKNLGLGLGWTKCFCQYQTKSKTFTLIPYNQLSGKITSAESLQVTSCICKDEQNDKFGFTVSGKDLGEGSGGLVVTHTVQALSEYDRKNWVEALGGTWPAVNTLQRIRADSVEENLNSRAFTFLKDCLNELESRGLTDQGLYRVGGVVSKVKSLLNMALEPQTGDPALDMTNTKQWETKNIASAVKQYFRDLSKPLMTYQLYNNFLEAAKHESESGRVNEILLVLQKLPRANKEILKVLIRHLSRVTARQDENLMSAFNLGVVFGPTLLRPREETVATIMDIKFCNEVIEILINHSEHFFPPVDSSFELLNNNTRQPSVDSQSIGEQSSKVDLTASPAQVPRNLPKRTHSFSSFSQLSTNSLPDIKAFNRQQSPLERMGSNTMDRVHDRPRSKSHQHDFPPPNPSTHPTQVSSAYITKVATKQDDLMASLKLMNSLAADLPTATSPFKRSYTLNPRRLQRKSPAQEVTRKPPLPKLSVVPLTPVSTSPLTSPSCSNPPLFPGQVILPSPLPSPKIESRTKQLNNKLKRPTDLPNKLVSAFEGFGVGPSFRDKVYPNESNLLINEEFDSKGQNEMSNSTGKVKPKVFISQAALRLASPEPGIQFSNTISMKTSRNPEPDTISMSSNYSHSSRGGSEDRIGSNDFRNVPSSSPLPISGQLNKEGFSYQKPSSCVNLSSDSGMMGSPSPPSDSMILINDHDTERFKDSQSMEDGARENLVRAGSEDIESVLSCSLSEASDTSGSKYENVVIESPLIEGTNHYSDKENNGYQLDNNRQCLDNVDRPVSGQYDNVKDTKDGGGKSPCYGGDILFNRGARLNSLNRILTNGQTTNV